MKRTILRGLFLCAFLMILFTASACAAAVVTIGGQTPEELGIAGDGWGRINIDGNTVVFNNVSVGGDVCIEGDDLYVRLIGVNTITMANSDLRGLQTKGNKCTLFGVGEGSLVINTPGTGTNPCLDSDGELRMNNLSLTINGQNSARGIRSEGVLFLYKCNLEINCNMYAMTSKSGVTIVDSTVNATCNGTVIQTDALFMADSDSVVNLTQKSSGYGMRAVSAKNISILIDSVITVETASDGLVASDGDVYISQSTVNVHSTYSPANSGENGYCIYANNHLVIWDSNVTVDGNAVYGLYILDGNGDIQDSIVKAKVNSYGAFRTNPLDQQPGRTLLIQNSQVEFLSGAATGLRAWYTDVTIENSRVTAGGLSPNQRANYGIRVLSLTVKDSTVHALNNNEMGVYADKIEVSGQSEVMGSQTDNTFALSTSSSCDGLFLYPPQGYMMEFSEGDTEEELAQIDDSPFETDTHISGSDMYRNRRAHWGRIRTVPMPVPQTGDRAQPALWSMLCMLALAGAAVTMKKRLVK